MDLYIIYHSFVCVCLPLGSTSLLLPHPARIPWFPPNSSSESGRHTGCAWSFHCTGLLNWTMAISFEALVLWKHDLGHFKSGNKGYSKSRGYVQKSSYQEIFVSHDLQHLNGLLVVFGYTTVLLSNSYTPTSCRDISIHTMGSCYHKVSVDLD